MEEIYCRIRIYWIEGLKETGTVWIEVEQEGKKNLFRIRRYSENNYFLFSDGNSSLNQALIDCILKRLLERDVILEGGKLVWQSGVKES